MRVVCVCTYVYFSRVDFTSKRGKEREEAAVAVAAARCLVATHVGYSPSEQGRDRVGDCLVACACRCFSHVEWHGREVARMWEQGAALGKGTSGIAIAKARTHIAFLLLPRKSSKDH